VGSRNRAPATGRACPAAALPGDDWCCDSALPTLRQVLPMGRSQTPASAGSRTSIPAAAGTATPKRPRSTRRAAGQRRPRRGRTGTIGGRSSTATGSAATQLSSPSHPAAAARQLTAWRGRPDDATRPIPTASGAGRHRAHDVGRHGQRNLRLRNLSADGPGSDGGGLRQVAERSRPTS
jgi:hypothetical protein